MMSATVGGMSVSHPTGAPASVAAAAQLSSFARDAQGLRGGECVAPAVLRSGVLRSLAGQDTHRVGTLAELRAERERLEQRPSHTVGRVSGFGSGAARTLKGSTKMDARLDKRPLVLVVDDDARSAALLALLLRADGYETEVTIDGAAALARLTRDPVPEALVTDLHMPHADGLAVGRYARSRRAEIAIFVVTGYPHLLESAPDGVEGPLEVLTKPLDYPDLLRRLVSALGSVKAP